MLTNKLKTPWRYIVKKKFILYKLDYILLPFIVFHIFFSSFHRESNESPKFYFFNTMASVSTLLLSLLYFYNYLRVSNQLSQDNTFIVHHTYKHINKLTNDHLNVETLIPEEKSNFQDI